MIVTVTCNPAVDLTYRVPRLTPGAVHRVERVEERAGGKGVNVARVLARLGESVVVTGMSDQAFSERVEQAGLTSAFVPVLRSVRRTVVIHADDSTTGLWEPGPAPTDPHQAASALTDRVEELLAGADALVVAGSLPVEVDVGLPARLAALGQARSLPVILDLDEDPLVVAADAGGSVLVPNLDELSHLVDPHHDLDVVDAAGRLSARNRAPVVVTLGADGMIAATGGTCWHARPPSAVRGNPTGAGDSAVAAIARGLVRRDSWPEILADAVAVSAATVASPVAGEIDLDCYQAWRPDVPVDTIDALVTRRQP